MRTLIALAIVLAIASPIRADHCETWTTTTTTNHGVFIAQGGFYAFTECWTYDPQCNVTAWIYEESNGIEGLQRDDDVHSDTCHGMIPADTIIF